ncbi:MAG: tripartite tricarboxylate transporter substrate binding protein [Rhizobiales bacterium]|nr:tripartite tricarboxylate transporter substrate binding protein [Hyphomicrobiales bacterium]
MMNRRTLLRAAALAPLAAAGPAFDQAGWPDRVIRIVVPFAPGSFTDVSARLLAVELTEQLGQSVVVENRSGAGGTAGTTAVVRAAPDGNTLLLTDTSLSISPGIYPNLPYDPVKDLAQISRIADSPSILLVRPGLGPRTLAELVALAKQRPGEITFGSGGPGSSAHLAMELLLNVAGVRALHVPFRGVAAAITEVIAGRVDMAIASLASGVAHVKGGTLLGLAVSGEKRSALLPEVPTFIEAGQPRYDMSYWWGVAAPARTPPPIIERLNREIVRACAQPRLREAFLKQAAVAVTSTPAEMTRHLEREVGVWREVIKSAKVTIQ